MNSKLFVNLAIKDLEKTKQFYTKLGFSFNTQFSNEEGVCMIIGPDNYVMLLTEKLFKTFTTKEICDTSRSNEALISISMESKQAVDEMLNKVAAAGGKQPKPAVDEGFMYSGDFEDLDGHAWGVFWMDPTSIQ